MSRQRQKGTQFETEVARFLRGEYTEATGNLIDSMPHKWGRNLTDYVAFPDAERTGSRAYELGDLTNTDPWTIECKNQKKMALSAWMDQAVAAAERTGKLPVVVHKRRQRNIIEAYATMPLWALTVHQIESDVW